MGNSIQAARALAESIRYSYDKPTTLLRFNRRGELAICAQNELRISPFVTPDLFTRLGQACERLEIPHSAVSAFIYLSSDVQANCHIVGEQHCILRFSSALVELLDSDEFEFVVGHELGHFLLLHPAITSSRIEDLMQSRAMEISVDRIGLIASQSVEIAIRAMMKTTSGLSNRHLRFDVSAFMKQCETAAPNYVSANSTHPSMLVRTRAILWFAMSTTFGRRGRIFSRDEIDSIDSRIQRDANRFIEEVAIEHMNDAKASLLLWTAAHRAVSDGAYDLTEQKAMARLVGDDLALKLKQFLANLSADEVAQEIKKRLHDAAEQLRRSMPNSIEQIKREINDTVDNAFPPTH